MRNPACSQPRDMPPAPLKKSKASGLAFSVTKMYLTITPDLVDKLWIPTTCSRDGPILGLTFDSCLSRIRATPQRGRRNRHSWGPFRGDSRHEVDSSSGQGATDTRCPLDLL